MKKVLAVFLVMLSGCATTREFEEPPQAKVHHVVLCWLKEPGNVSHRRQIIARSNLFRRIPGVIDLRAGEVMESDREIVDSSFDVAIVMSFASREDMERYIEHPAHVKIVRESFMPILQKIVVYDFQE